jgi:hypothetical protein
VVINESYGVDDMSHRIARLVEPLLRFLLPGLGRHRLAARCTPPENQRPAPSYAEGPTDRHAGFRPLRGEDTVMVRPYLVAYERREEERRRRSRRRNLRLAVHGIDIGPWSIHGVEVTA